MLEPLKRYDEAEPLVRESLAGREKKQPDHWETFSVKARLASILLRQARQRRPLDAAAAESKLAEAATLLHAGYAGIKAQEQNIPLPKRTCLTDCLRNLVELYTTWDKPTEAAKWQAQLDARLAEQPK